MLFIKTLRQCKWTSGYSKTNKFSSLSHTVCQNRPQKAKYPYQLPRAVNETAPGAELVVYNFWNRMAGDPGPSGKQ